jgi:hypothetical protein
MQPVNEYTDHIKVTPPTTYERTSVRIVTLMVIYRLENESKDLLVIDVTDDDWATAGFTREAIDWLRKNTVVR